MLFFDLEFYVPKNDRKSSSGSLIVNPNLKEHKLLGGTFYAKQFDEKIPDNPKFNQLWLWDYKNNEKELLRAIHELFCDEWANTQKEKKRILGKPIVDLVVCGIGISWFDLHALYCRNIRYHIDSPEQLFNIYFKCRNIELANVCSYLFQEEAHLYPKTAKEIMGRINIKGTKNSSKNVWKMYDADENDNIKKRTTEELKHTLSIYQKIQNDVAKLRR